MNIQIYDSLSREKRAFQPIEEGVVRLYVCGVTVYDRSHTGHAMSALVFDMVRRYLEYRGYRVRHVVNFTDVDDKIIQRASNEAVSAFEIADRYAREYLLDMQALGVLPASIYPRVSSEMPAIVQMIQTLIDSENAYVADNGDVYYEARSFDAYGALSGRSFEDAESQDPEPSTHKRAASDFALWKSAKPGEPAWEAPWGEGRPGWHIECSAMARRHLGDQIDIHGGGNDLMFPHHENEIAQSEAACGCQPFAQFWMHNGMLQFPMGGSGTTKMSKSLGNVVPIGDFLKEHSPNVFRFFVFSSHYRKPVNLTEEAIEAATAGIARLEAALAPARAQAAGAASDTADQISAAAEALAQALDGAKADFVAHMDEDFGTPEAIADCFGLAKAINRARDAGVDAESLSTAQEGLVELAGVLGIMLGESAGAADASGDAGKVDALVQILLQMRAEARAAKDWALSDTLRDKLLEAGIEVMDGPNGAEWRWR